MPLRASESIATRIDEPCGIVTRTAGPGLPHATSSAASAHERRLLRRTGHLLKRMLEKDGRGECVDVALSVLRRASHFPNRAERDGGRVSLIDHLDLEPG